VIRGAALTATPQDRQDLATFMPALRKALEAERGFRTRQLAERNAAEQDNSATTSPESPGPTVHEMTSLLILGAQRAIDDTDRALAAMSEGRYGYCEACAAPVPLAVLWADPRARLCLQCHRPCEDPVAPRTSHSFISGRRSDAAAPEISGHPGQRHLEIIGPP
jgi:RNA polymerase-binding transcription factor DksA